MINLFDGEPRIFLDRNGATIKCIGGQPIMDAGLENSVLISLHTNRNWWGNSVYQDSDVHIGSDFENRSYESITKSNLEDRRKAAIEALKWFTDSGLASNIVIEVINKSGFRVDTIITIFHPDFSKTLITDIKNGINWIAQRDTPAYQRSI